MKRPFSVITPNCSSLNNIVRLIRPSLIGRNVVPVNILYSKLIFTFVIFLINCVLGDNRTDRVNMIKYYRNKNKKMFRGFKENSNN